MTAPRQLDSQEALAASIARAVQLGLPVPGESPDVARAVEAALSREARESERSLAAGRVLALGVYLVFLVVALMSPRAVGFPAMPLLNVIVAATWFLAAAALLYALRRGIYHRHLRRIVPTADGLGLVAIAFVLERTLAQYPGGAPNGVVMAAGAGCALIAFSGSLRLSRSSARFTTIVATAAAFLVGVAAQLRDLEILALAGAVAVTGLVSTRLTRVIRRVITNEIARIQLARLYDDAREAAAAREEVLKIVSHDLRNPLSTIGMAAEMMLEQTDDASKERGVTIIRRTSERMNRMVQDLLDVAKLEAGRLAIDVEDIAVNVLLEETVEAFRPLAESKGMTITSAIEPDVPPIVADRGRIDQVLSNLIGNAMKFTPSGGEITLRASSEGTAVRFAVSDTGPGIPPDQLQRIFGRFWQAKPSDRRGLGLGLTIAKSIVEAHGGWIGVESRPGEGAEFWFTIPASAPVVS